MQENITQVCNCLRQRKPNVHIRAPLQSSAASSPFELIFIDFMHLEKSLVGYEYILLITDSFTRFAQAYLCKNKSAHTDAKKICDDFILRLGFPCRIHHDQETEFENDLFHQLEKLCDMVLYNTLPSTRQRTSRQYESHIDINALYPSRGSERKMEGPS